jgi:peptidoglycan/LPS O-acetylase OafA/YrhL
VALFSPQSPIARRARAGGHALVRLPERRYVEDIPAAAPRVIPPSFGSRLQGIEGLRALAACSVLVYHSWLYSAPDGRAVRTWPLRLVLPDLAFGVVLFFTLSGFLLYRPFVAAMLRGTAPPSARRYLRNRLFRIAPAYLVILLFVALVLRSALSHAGGGLRAGPMTDPTLLTKNILLVQNYIPSSILTGIGPAWSLAVEVVFYLALPPLALLGWRLARSTAARGRRRLAAFAPAVLLLVVGISGKLVAAHAFQPGLYHGWNADWQSVVERSFWCQADLFAFGMALAVLRVDVEDGHGRFAYRVRTIAAPLGLLAYLVTARMTGTTEQLGYSFYNTLIAFAFACLLALVVLPPRRMKTPMLVRVLETRPFVSAGLISYSVFLWHEPLVRWLQAHDLTSGGSAGFALNTLLLLGLTAVFSTVTYRWVELPALRRKVGTGNRRPVPQVPAEQVQAAP